MISSSLEDMNESLAYILGFTWADGNIIDNYGDHKVTYRIHKQDRDILEFIKSNLGCTNTISTKGDACSLHIYGIQLVKWMMSNGVVPNKSNSICSPRIPTGFERSFISGFLDGDGSIKRNQDSVEFTSNVNNKENLDNIKEVLWEELGIEGKYNTYTKEGRKEVYRLCYHGDRARKLLGWLYNSEGFHGSRKREIYLRRSASQID